MSRWPEYIQYALYLLTNDSPDDPSFADEFVARWGGVESGPLLKALDQGANIDKLFARIALASMDGDEAREHAVVGLGSPETLDRWASAICLGNRRDPRAVHVLETMLTELLEEQYSPDSKLDWLYQQWRGFAPTLLYLLGDRRSVPVLRHAIAQVFTVVRESLPESGGAFDPDRHLLNMFQDTMVYTCGRLGALGILTGFDVGSDRLAMWRVHLLVGYLHDQYPIIESTWWRDMPELAADIHRLLGECFGLDEAERQQAMHRYQFTLLSQAQTRSEYEAEVVRQGRVF